MTDWTPELEDLIKRYACSISDLFNGIQYERIVVASRDPDRIFRDVRAIEEKMGVEHSPNPVAYVPQMISLAAENGSEAARKLKNIWASTHCRQALDLFVDWRLSEPSAGKYWPDQSTRKLADGTSVFLLVSDPGYVSNRLLGLKPN